MKREKLIWNLVYAREVGSNHIVGILQTYSKLFLMNMKI